MIDRQDIPIIAYVIYYAVLAVLAYPVAWWIQFCLAKAAKHFRRALRIERNDS